MSKSICTTKLTNNIEIFDKLTEEIYNFWKENEIFVQSIEQNKNKPTYGFYDGPPFATGLPHYGHILAGFIKDTILRYHNNLGKNVPRYAGWDCIAEGTYINLLDGTSIPIEQFENYLKNNITLYVDTLKKSNKINGIIQNKVTDFIDKKIKNCIELTFEDGNKLICTPNHKILTTNGYIEAKDLINNKTDIISYSQNPIKQNIIFDNWILITESYKFFNTNLLDTLKNSAYARILGYLITGGKLFFNKLKNRYVAYLYINYKIDRNKIISDIELICKQKPKYRFVNGVNIINLPKVLIKSFITNKYFALY
jgi:hypothetical protein